jgi:hypothetical protein
MVLLNEKRLSKIDLLYHALYQAYNVSRVACSKALFINKYRQKPKKYNPLMLLTTSCFSGVSFIKFNHINEKIKFFLTNCMIKYVKNQ